MKLEITHKTFSPSDFNLDNNGLAIVDYFELLGTPEYNSMRNYERVQQVYETLSRLITQYENRLEME
jgi:hypothetical protein